MEIDERAPVVVRRERVVRASAGAVWRVLADVGGWSRWAPPVAFAFMRGPLREKTSFQWRLAGIYAVSRLEVVEPPCRLGWSTRRFGTRGGHLWTLTPEGAWTKVESLESAGGWVAWLLRGTIRRTLERATDLWIAALAERLEGEEG